VADYVSGKDKGPPAIGGDQRELTRSLDFRELVPRDVGEAMAGKFMMVPKQGR
jgi:hypothetical protein